MTLLERLSGNAAMKDKILAVLEFVSYWSIVGMPFAVAISQGAANACIGCFSVAYLVRKVVVRELPKVDRAVALPLLCLLAAAFLSLMNTDSFDASFHGISKLLRNFILLFACAESIRDRKHVVRIAIAVCCGLALVLVDIAWQLNTGRDFIRNDALQVGMLDLPRPTASFRGANPLAIYLTALVPLVFGLGLFYFKGTKKALMLAFGGIVFLCDLVTLSRGAALGAFLAILSLSIVKKEKWLWVPLMAIILIGPFFLPANAKKWAKESHYNPAVLMFNEDRLSIYQNTLNMIKHHPFVGVGVNTFSRNYSRYKLESVEKRAATKDTWYGHNTYLHMAGEIGLIGLAAFLWFLFQGFRLSIANYRSQNDPFLKAAALSVIFCLGAFLVNGLTESNLYYPKVAMVFWYLFGLSLALKKVRLQPSEGTSLR